MRIAKLVSAILSLALCNENSFDRSQSFSQACLNRDTDKRLRISLIGRNLRGVHTSLGRREDVTPTTAFNEFAKMEPPPQHTEHNYILRFFYTARYINAKMAHTH